MRAAGPATSWRQPLWTARISEPKSAELTLLNAGGSIPVTVLNDTPITVTIVPVADSTQTALTVDLFWSQANSAAATTATANNVR